MNLVIDASVVAKCLVPEAGSDQARELLYQWTQGRIDTQAPEILAAEVASMLWKRAVRGLLPVDKVITLYEEFTELQLPLMPIGDLVASALKLALQHGHSVYDGLYVALALKTNCQLVTADAKLFQALRGTFPQIHLLRDWR